MQLTEFGNTVLQQIIPFIVDLPEAIEYGGYYGGKDLRNLNCVCKRLHCFIEEDFILQVPQVFGETFKFVGFREWKLFQQVTIAGFRGDSDEPLPSGGYYKIKPAIYFAADRGNQQWVQLLLKAGAKIDPETRDYRNTPLLLAAQGGHEIVIKQLLAAGANIHKVDKFGCGVLLHTMIYLKRKCLFRFGVIDSGKSWLIKNQVQLKVIDCSKIKLVKKLLKKGANPDGVENSLRESFYLSPQNHLPRNIFDVQSILKATKTPLMIAVEIGNISIIKLLLDAQANIDLQDANGDTALHLAVCRGNCYLVETLLDYKPDVNIQNGSGDTALHLLQTKKCHAQRKQRQHKVNIYDSLMQQLLNAGADSSLKNNDNKTPTDLAKWLESENTSLVPFITGNEICAPPESDLC